MSGPDPGQVSDGSAAPWVDAWRQAIRSVALLAGVVELPANRFIELSPPAADLFGAQTPGQVALDVANVVDSPEHVELAAHALSTGAIEAFQARRRLHCADGSFLDATISCRVIRSSDSSDLALWIASGAPFRDADMAPATVGFPRGPEPSLSHYHVRTEVTADWRFDDVGVEMEEFLGHPPEELLGTPAFDHVHRKDLAWLVFAFAEATSTGRATAEVRLRHRDGEWRQARAVVDHLAGSPQPRFALTVTPRVTRSSSDVQPHIRELARDLARIAEEMEVVAIMQGPLAMRTTWPVPQMADLSVRQREIVVRLASGQRVPRVAREMYLSQSTIRNHLSAIFAKFGVHSQEQLLGLIHGGSVVDGE